MYLKFHARYLIILSLRESSFFFTLCLQSFQLRKTAQQLARDMNDLMTIVPAEKVQVKGKEQGQEEDGGRKGEDSDEGLEGLEWATENENEDIIRPSENANVSLPQSTFNSKVPAPVVTQDSDDEDGIDLS